MNRATLFKILRCGSQLYRSRDMILELKKIISIERHHISMNFYLVKQCQTRILMYVLENLSFFLLIAFQISFLTIRTIFIIIFLMFLSCLFLLNFSKNNCVHIYMFRKDIFLHCCYWLQSFLHVRSFRFHLIFFCTFISLSTICNFVAVEIMKKRIVLSVLCRKFPFRRFHEKRCYECKSRKSCDWVFFVQ